LFRFCNLVSINEIQV